MSRNSSKQAQAKGGFTLVELVVVIAVLAILAGVGAVAYNGYIEYAKKGQDRALVGEILHAFELADYSDPGLFAEGETAHFYFTNGGAKVLKASKNDELEKSLEDALGDLGSLKLSYSGWNSADMSQISEILNSAAMQSIINDSNSYLNKYLNSEENPGAASFAGNMSELWSVVEDKIDAFSQGEDKGYLKKIIDYSTDTTYAPQILAAWQSSDTSTGAMPQNGSLVVHGANLARNYAFAIFVENKYSSQLTPSMKQTLDELKQTNGVTQVSSYYVPCKGTDWDSIVTDYVNNQAKADALAYLALMEAGKTVISTGEGADVSDKVLRDKLSSVVGGVSALLDKSTSIDDYKAFVTTFTGDMGSSTVTFSMKKVNGVMVPTDFSDPDLNPRGSSKEETIENEKLTCSEPIHNSTLTLSAGRHGGLSPSAQDIKICSIDDNYRICTLTINDSTIKSIKSCVSDNACVTCTTSQITAVSTGSAKVTITVEMNDGTEKSTNVNVTVH